ncbi:MAG: 2-C-methyl-D-erythritol 2,4-cyclodiphosphate synthase [Ectothiorhodospiraceae bacterium]|nr:2-C-methyl-D-erythritol 2,4-cyclodiphosphate synthase [Ectothiorhodospiraceae bacterium]
MSDFRIGYGYDVHKLIEDKTLVLGGVKISEEIGPVAHSDGDVLLHAICDAIFGAAAMGDIGEHFPNTDDRYMDISSIVLLQETLRLVQAHGFSLVNIDATIVLERPKILPHRDEIRESIAKSALLPLEHVSLKATTSEGLGFVGEGRGIVAHAVALLQRTT